MIRGTCRFGLRLGRMVRRVLRAERVALAELARPERLAVPAQLVEQGRPAEWEPRARRVQLAEMDLPEQLVRPGRRELRVRPALTA